MIKLLEIIIRRGLFFGSFALAALAVIEKAANLLGYTLLGGRLVLYRVLEIAAIGLLFSMAMQLHQIRLLLSSRSNEPSK
jgi:hypothetical protein